MTAAGNMALAKRVDRSFRFLKNGVVADEFHPASARLHFASKSTDTLTLGGLPPGLLAAGNTVTVQYRADADSAWATVFSGDVARITDTRGRGDERQHTVVCEGPWGTMSRLVFRQTWAPNVTGASFSSARVILNQAPTGEDYTITQQIQEIANFAAAKCGFSAGTASLGNTVLPKDETRDITCAAAIQRELRFFPKKVVRFDYSGPTLVISEPSTSGNAGYVADVPKTAREYVYNAHPISAVDVYTDDVQVVTGNNNVDRKIAALSHQVYPSGADTSGLDVLHCYVPLARASSHSSWKSLESDTEEITSYNLNSNVWWRNKHPRLKDIPLANITISDGDYEPKTYTRIARNTADELAEAGLHSKVAVFTCKCKIATDDDVEEDILLTMEFLTTDATTRTYTWQTGSSSVAGETLPDGLAEALYRQRAGSLVQERMTIRLSDDWPVIGDAADGLVLQEIDVDCGDCTAALSFGQPEALSAEDMRSLLNGFRQRGYAENAPVRANGEADASDATPVGGIKPLSSSEWSPGTKVKTTLKKVIAANRSSTSTTKSIVLDVDDIGDNDTAKFRDITLVDATTGQEKTVKILATDDGSLSSDGRRFHFGYTKTTSSGETTVTIGEGVVNIGGYAYFSAGGTVANMGSGTQYVCAVVTLASGSVTFAAYSSTSALNTAQSDMSKYIFPLYKVVDYNVEIDYRPMPNAGCWEIAESVSNGGTSGSGTSGEGGGE